MNPRVLIGWLALAALVAAALPAAAQDVTAEVRTWSGQSLRLSQPSLEVFYTIVPKEEGPGGAQVPGAAGGAPGNMGSGVSSGSLIGTEMRLSVSRADGSTRDTMMKLRRWLRDETGNVLLFTIVLVVPLMIIFGGLAADLAYLGTVDNEVQRSMDAAALAGAGQLRFDSSVFPAARTWAQNYALLNTYRAGTVAPPTINLTLNTPNAANGDIVLGIWNGSSFTPSLDGTQVNAVLCRYQTTVPTSFLRLLGFTSLPVSGESIAWATQPVTPPPTACVFPIALTSCFFGGSTALGCGATVTFISSSGGSAVGGNSAAWASLVPGQAPNDSNILNQVQAAASGTCTGTPLSTGNNEPVNNGQLNNVVNWLSGNSPNAFPAKYAASPELVVKKADGSGASRGKGWEVFVPVID